MQFGMKILVEMNIKISKKKEEFYEEINVESF
jgi:hypothetical protein